MTDRRRPSLARHALLATALAGALAAVGTRAAAASGTSGAPAPGTAAAGLTLTSLSPTGTSVAGAAPLVLRFSQPLAAGTPLPSLSPRIAGAWARDTNELVYRPDGGFPPGNAITVSVPGGPGGVRSRSGATLTRRVVATFSTRGGSLLGAQEALALLDYLPAHLVATAPGPAGATGTATPAPPTPGALERAFYGPAPGRLVVDAWAPAPLKALFAPGADNVLTTGALESFQRVHGLPMTGVLDAATWRALTAATADPARNLQPGGYTYALADQHLPETLTVYDNGRVVVHTPVNTGIPASPTADGSFLVYERLASQVMRGTNPWGTPYADPVSWVAYFNGGDAVHYIGRAAYGYPQSLGCIETPYAAAETAWPYLRLGTVVTVER